MGGKWTTYRQMAEDAVDKALETHEELRAAASPCVTPSMKLLGADRVGVVCGQKFDRILVTLREQYGLDRDVAEHLLRNYGTRALQIAEVVRRGYWHRRPNASTRRLVGKYPFLEAEVVFAVRQEYALSAVDVLARRTRLAYVDSEAAEQVAPKVVEIMGELLKARAGAGPVSPAPAPSPYPPWSSPVRQWSKSRKKEEVEEVKRFLQTMRNPSARVEHVE